MDSNESENRHSSHSEGRVALRVNPFTDYGFKRLFGTEPNKDLLIDFINGVLNGERVVRDISYLNSERLPTKCGGKVIFIDVICVGTDGTTFLVEMQRAYYQNMKKRLLFYGCRLMSDQLDKGQMYNLKPDYVICLMEQEYEADSGLRSDYSMIREQDGARDLNILRIIIFQLKLFDKKPDECLTNYDKWLYLLKNMEFMERLPKELQNKVMDKVMSQAELELLTPTERVLYDMSLDEYKAVQLSLDYSESKGRAEGKAEGKAEVAKAMKDDGVAINQIAIYTGLSEAEITAL